MPELPNRSPDGPWNVDTINISTGFTKLHEYKSWLLDKTVELGIGSHTCIDMEVNVVSDSTCFAVMFNVPF